MKALSVRQPWAWALVTKIEGSPVGDKIVENRTWPHSHRGPLLIVSSRKVAANSAFVKDLIEQNTGHRVAYDELYLALGSVLGVVDMVACLTKETYLKCRAFAESECVDLMKVIKGVDQGKLILPDETGQGTDWWAHGPWCHIYANIRRLPIKKTSGRLGLYEIQSIGGVPVQEWIEQEGVWVR